MQEQQEQVLNLEQEEGPDDSIMHNLYAYLFHFNPYTNFWFAFKREDSVNYFNGALDSSQYFKHKEIKGLIEIVIVHSTKSTV